MKAVRCKRMRTELPSPPDITDSMCESNIFFQRENSTSSNRVTQHSEYYYF